MPTAYFDFGPTWQLSTTGAWTAQFRPGGALVMERGVGPTGHAVARTAVPVYNAPARKLLRFCLEGSIKGGIGAHASVRVGAAEVWRMDLQDLTSATSYQEVALTDPLGGDIHIEFRVEDDPQAAGIAAGRIVWSRPRLELLGWGEEPPAWGAAGSR